MFLQQHPDKVLPGDKKPETKWDQAVNHYMEHLLTLAGGLTNYKTTTETYSFTQTIGEFNTELIKLVFDAASCPEAILDDVLKFVQGVGKTLRSHWETKSKNYQTALLGQCHEAVQISSTGEETIYYPKIKYYFISVDSSQTAFTSNCAKVETVTFNFQYEYYVTGLKASVLDKTSSDYKKFVQFLDKAQQVSYEEADNLLDGILDVTSESEGLFQVLGANLAQYPKV